MKYICFERDDIELGFPFPELIQHKEAAKALRPSDRILSAGFCSIENDPDSFNPHIQCWGESDGLGISSRGEHDAQVLHFTISLPTMKPAGVA